MRSEMIRGIVGFIDPDDADTDEIGAALQTFLGRFSRVPPVKQHL